MRLNRVLTIDQTPRQLIDERVVLDLYAPGRANYTVVVDSDHPLKPFQFVTFDLGYSNQDLHRWFRGYVEKVVPVGDRRAKVFCRELSAVLAKPLPLNLRHVSAREVVTEINRLTGLNFATPETDYSTTKVANFYNIGTGYAAMNEIGRVFNIVDYIWQQQAGIVYVGSWADSRWANKKDLLLPQGLFDKQSENKSAKVLAMPALRPGVRLRGNRITTIEFKENHMTVAWL